MRGIATTLLAALLSSCALAPMRSFDYAAASRATVMLSDSEGHGSGVVVAPGVVLTAAHVVKDEKGRTDKTLIATDSRGIQHKLSVSWVSADSDLAELRGDLPADMAAAPIACDEPRAGDDVVIAGNPLSLRWAFAWGHVSSDNKYKDGSIVLNLDLIPGDSGGPVFNSAGQVVGIADAYLGVPGMLGMSAGPSGYSLMVPVTGFCKVASR